MLRCSGALDARKESFRIKISELPQPNRAREKTISAEA
jgi:hypothetical protein